MDKTQTMNVAYDRIKFIAIVFCMSSICSYDHEIMQLTHTEEYLVCSKRRNVTG